MPESRPMPISGLFTALFSHCREHLDEPVDLVLLHAVLEWLKDPREVLNSLPTLTRPGGWLSHPVLQQKRPDLASPDEPEFQAGLPRQL